MSPKLQSSQHGPFTGGVNTISGAFVNPQGTVLRSSNLLGLARGALTTCDGSAITAWKQGAIQKADGKIISLALFQPADTNPYYLALKQSFDIKLGTPPEPFTSAAAGGGVTGSLNPTHHYVYAISTLDGVGGESRSAGTATVTGSSAYTIGWEGVPNAFGYNIWREDLDAVGIPATIGATGGSSQSATISTAFGSPLQATVLDSNNSPASGVVVTFAAPSLGASGTFAGSITTTATTDANGNAITGVFTANGVAGTYTVTATASGVSGTASFSLTNLPVVVTPPASIVVASGSGQSATVNTAFAAPLLATVGDSQGHPVSGVIVTFSPPSSGASGVFSGGVNTATTNSHGVATSTVFTANGTAGTYNVAASVAGVTAVANFSLTNTSGIGPPPGGQTILLASINGGVTVPSPSTYAGQPGISFSLQSPWPASIGLRVGDTVAVSGTSLYDGNFIIAGLSPGPDPNGMTLLAGSNTGTAIVLNQGQVQFPISGLVMASSSSPLAATPRAAGGGFQLLVGPGLPVPQYKATMSAAGRALTFSYTDTGNNTALPNTTLISSAFIKAGGAFPGQGQVQFSLQPGLSTANFPLNQPFVVSGNSFSPINGNYRILQIVDSSTLIGTYVGTTPGFAPLPPTGMGTGGSINIGLSPVDTTQTTVLLKIPAQVTTAPQSYDNSNIVAVFPASVQQLSTSGIAGNIQLPIAPPQVGQGPVPIIAHGLIPTSQQIASITAATDPVTLEIQNNILFQPPDILTPSLLQVGDTIHIYGTGFHNGSYIVRAIGFSQIAVVPVHGISPVHDEFGFGTIQYEFVSVITGAAYTATVGSMQTIAQSNNVVYNGTWQVRRGGSNQENFVVIIPNIAGIPTDSGGGFFGNNTGVRSLLTSPISLAGTVPIDDPGRGLNPEVRNISVLSNDGHFTSIVLRNTFPPATGQNPIGASHQIVVKVVGSQHYDGTYSIDSATGVSSSAPTGTGLLVVGVPSGVPPGFIENTGSAVVIYPTILVLTQQPFNAPALSQQTISGAADPGYDGTWQVLAGGLTQGFEVHIPGGYNLGPSGGGHFGAQTGIATPPPTPGPPSSIVIGQQHATINGGIIGLLSPVPQMLQFTNRMILALGNGYRPQYYPDVNTVLNTANTYGVVSLTAQNPGDTGGEIYSVQLTPNTPPGGNQPAPGLNIGDSIIFSGLPGFNGVGQVTGIGDAVLHKYEIWMYIPSFNAVIPPSLTTALVTQSACPIPNNYKVNFPVWQSGIAVSVGDIYVPTSHGQSLIGGCGANSGGIYIRCTQAGITGTPEPTWPDPCLTVPTPGLFPIRNIIETPPAPPAPPAVGSQPQISATGGAVWEEVGWLNSPSGSPGVAPGIAPAPTGAAHVAVYSATLFFFNTYPVQTGSASVGWGIDGPTSLRQSDVNNPFNWNPANQDFIDKDDGSEGMGLGTFTIAAVGIPPVGSLFAFKNYTSFQITGLFGAGINISRVKTERGCMAPRTILFIPGYGVARLTHLGISIVDGVNDNLISDPVRPYLFKINDRVVGDIHYADSVWLPASAACLTANPPMYNCLIPVGAGGSSSGQLVRSLSWDVIQPGWYPIDFPFSIGTVTQTLQSTLAPATLLAGFQDGLIQRWQYGDPQWLFPGDMNTTPFNVSWSYRTPVTASENPDQRVFVQEVSVKGVLSPDPITAVVTIDGVPYTNTSQPVLMQQRGGFGMDFLAVIPVRVTGQRFYADISGSGEVEIDADNFHIVPKPLAGRLIIA